jgi:hypothetical protein
VHVAVSDLEVVQLLPRNLGDQLAETLAEATLRG